MSDPTAFNVKFEVPVKRGKLDSWLLYFKESGYTVTEKPSADGDQIYYYAEVPGHYSKSTPIAVSVKYTRWTHWICVRIPMNLKAKS